MSASLYHSATGVQAPHCMHVIGVGRTGAAYVEALLRTGEVEDHLADPRATFAAMVVDIGDQDMGLAQDYAASFVKRLESRGIPSDRFMFQAMALPVPSKDEFFEGMNRTREFLKLEYPRYYWNPNFEFLRAQEIHDAPRPASISRALSRKASTPTPTTPARDRWTSRCATSSTISRRPASPSMVTVCFSLAGGTRQRHDRRSCAASIECEAGTVDPGHRASASCPHSGDPEL